MNLTLQRYSLIILGLLLAEFTYSQDLQLARKYVDTLAAPAMHGRGYVQQGDQKAADYIEQQFKQHGLRSFGDRYQQPFSIQVNTFPEVQPIKMGDSTLVPGRDFLVEPYSQGVEGTYRIVWLNKATVAAYRDGEQPWSHYKPGKTFIFIDTTGVDQQALKTFIDEHNFSNQYIAQVNKKIGAWRLSDTSFPVTHLQVKRSALDKEAKELTLQIQNKYHHAYETQNVIGYVEGSEKPDSFIVYSAHYDHLGRMGKQAYFPGANDDASGTAMLMDLARHYAQPEHQPRYSVAFMAFGGEEVGILGSRFYTKKPSFPLQQIRFVLNLDLMGTGSKGITVINGKVFEKAYDRLVHLNNENNYVTAIKARGKARNSDHYYFTENNVPAFFIYTRGEPGHYHDIYDRAETLPFTEYNDLFRLITGFSNRLMGH